MPTLCKKFTVTGRVQGVYYRAHTKDKAEELELTGYARNEDDGSVTVVACGDPGAIQLLQDWLWDGPPAAVVEQVTELSCTEENFDDFQVL